MNGKIISINPVNDDNGSHHSWIDQRGNTNYDHVMVINSDGKEITGKCSTRTIKPPYSAGDEIVCDFETTSRGNKFKGVKKADSKYAQPAGAQKSNSSWKDDDVDAIARQSAVKLLAEIMKSRTPEANFKSLTGDIYSQMVKSIYDFITTNGKDKNTRISITVALYEAVNIKTYNPEVFKGNTTMKDLFKFALTLHKFIHDKQSLPTKWEDYFTDLTENLSA